MKPNRILATALASALLAVVVCALAYANRSQPTAGELKAGALTALSAAGGKWATMHRDATHRTWKARVLRADGSITDVYMDEQFRVIGIDDATLAVATPAPSGAGDDN